MFRQEFEALRRAKTKAKFPEYDDEWVERMWGGVIKMKKATSAPRIEKNICEFLELSGHQAEKRAVMGRQIVAPDLKTSLGIIRGKSTYLPSTGTRGSADISATIYGVAVYIEVKKGKDKQSIHQKKYEEDVTRAGGFYMIAHDEDDFLIKYKEIIQSPRMVLMKGFMP